LNCLGIQADDEQSDWPGPEPGMSVMQLTDEEMDPDISFSQFLPARYKGTAIFCSNKMNF
jgi:hypothetical protein